MSELEGCAIILFSRVPIEGKVKKRLEPILSASECAVLQEAMALDIASKLATLDVPLLLSYSDEWRGVEGGESIRDAFIVKVSEAASSAPFFKAIRQQGEELGERMAHAMQETFDLGASSCLLMGSDLPCIMRNDIELAQRALSYSDVVLGPTEDGGYWLVGSRTPFPQMFEGKTYGSHTVLTEAVSTCRRYGLSVSLSRETFDVDEPNDYYQLCNQVTMGDFRLGWRTIEAVRHLMSVSAGN